LEIGDVTEEEAHEYLKLRGVSPEDAKSVYSLVGGRMVLLKYATDTLTEGFLIEGM
jgi:hypothetical protein